MSLAISFSMSNPNKPGTLSAEHIPVLRRLIGPVRKARRSCIRTYIWRSEGLEADRLLCCCISRNVGGIEVGMVVVAVTFARVAVTVTSICLHWYV